MKNKNNKNNNNKFHTIHGINNSIELLKLEKNKIISIFLLKDGKAIKHEYIKKNITILKDKCTILNNIDYNKKFPYMRSQGIVINFQFKARNLLPQFSSQNVCLLITESIEDPQNLGQIIRTSECAGINGLLLPQNRSVGITNSVLQVSQGAFLSLPIYTIGNISQTLLTLKKEGFWVVGVENGLDASKWHEIDYHGKIIFIVGSEGKGIRPNTLKHCDSIATIPMLGKINSLNVSAAVSVILFERNRQLSKKK
jgi:predicted rRNA methylase